MGLTTAYLVTTKNLEAFLNAIQTAKAPERFTNRFLEALDFSSSNDRLLIAVMKGLGFLDENGTPTQRYYDFLDQSQSGAVLAEAVREAYADLFAVNTKAQDMTVDDVKNKLRTLLRGEKSDKVLSLMANTFKALSSLADWSAPKPISSDSSIAQPRSETPDTTLDEEQIVTPSSTKITAEKSQAVPSPMSMHYNIQIHLPDSRDAAVFDAIFQSLKKHLF